MVRTVAERFHSDVCGAPDPRPALVQEARGLIARDAGDNKTADAAPPARSPGEELAQRAIDEAKADGNATRSALGAGTVAPASEPAAPSIPYKVSNLPPSQQPNAVAPSKAGTEPKVGATPKAGSAEKARTAWAGAAATKAKAPPETAAPPAANQKCRVWTASYGGQKSIIIRSVSDQVVNFTVLDVNAGSETREAEAFIAAYAKNGSIAGEYANQAQALDKAFELCPEG
jgi:hypothetical protein